MRATSSLLLATMLSLTVGLGCAGLKPPKSFVQTFDESAAWRVVQIRDGLEYSDAWDMIVDTVAKKFDLELVEREAGYLRTSWKYTYIVSKSVCDRYKSRIIVKFESGKKDAFSVKTETQWLTENGWVPGFDSMILEDVYGDLQGKVGRTRF